MFADRCRVRGQVGNGGDVQGGSGGGCSQLSCRIAFLLCALTFALQDRARTNCHRQCQELFERQLCIDEDVRSVDPVGAAGWH